MYRYLIILSLLSAWACQPNTEPGNDDSTEETTPDPRLNFTIELGERVGLITPDSCSREDVLALYGDSARIGQIHLGEGLFAEGVILFPDNPRRTVEIFWDPSIDPTYPSYFGISGTEDGETDWKTTEGITIGTPLAELERLNGRSFQFFGFGWDYGGRVSDWNGGNLDPTLGLRLDPEGSENVPETLIGDQTISSDNPALEGLEVVVSALEVNFGRSYNYPDGLWQSITDPGYTIEFADGQIIHRNGGQVTASATIYLDASCLESDCSMPGELPAGQWCFLEVDDSGNQCNLVLESTEQQLSYTPLGGRGNTLRFRRLTD